MSRPATGSAKLVQHIRELGNDRFGNPLSIRSAALAAACDVLPGSIHAMLSAPIARGEIVVCKVTPIGGRPINEYRKGGGVPAPAFKPLDTKHAGVALSTAGQAPRPTLSSKPQPAVGTTPAAGDRAPPPVEPAVTAPKAGDALDIAIDDKGTLTIATCEGVIELQPEQSRRLGNFMLGSQGVWNPF